jgi:hypothetical protein
VANSNKKKIEEINTAMKEWRQGDCVLGKHWFAWRLDPNFPLFIDKAKEDLPQIEVPGFVVITQTCDLVRSCEKRSFVEVCPLFQVDAITLKQIKKCQRPQFAYVPALEEHSLVADLDRIMTVEKTIVTQWTRKPGWTTDMELRHFVMALNRKRSRFAFPDPFNPINQKLADILKGRSGLNETAERAMQSLIQIRVRAAPEWSAENVHLTFWFIHDENEPDFEGESWDTFAKIWMNALPSSPPYSDLIGSATTYEDLKAIDLVESDEVDLDHFS